MIYITYYDSPIAKLLLASKDNMLIGLWLNNQKYYLANIKEELLLVEDNAVFSSTKIWLDQYFNGNNQIYLT